MSAEELKALERRFYELANTGNLKAVSELFASNCIMHSGSGRDFTVEEYGKYMVEQLKIRPDSHFTVHDIIAEGDKVAARWTLTFTHLPTNRRVTLWGMDLERVADGKIVESWFVTDSLSMMQQLGLVPPAK
jgi:predicted ester cyclase